MVGFRDLNGNTNITVLITAVLAMLLAGCAPSANAGGLSASVTASNDSYAVNRGAAQTISGLQVRIERPAHLRPPTPELGLDCGNHLVLTQVPGGAASTADVQAIKDYLNAAPLDPGLITPRPFVGSKTPPQLRWAAGARPFGDLPATCNGLLVITNSSQHPIIVKGAGVRIDSVPKESGFQFNELELCGFRLDRYYPTCYAGGAGSGVCGYSIDVTISATARAGSRQSGPIQGGEGSDGSSCPVPLVLNPGSSTPVILTLTASSVTATGLYRVTPYIQTDAGVLDFPKLASNVVFAAESDFTCYTYNDTTFVQVQPYDSVAFPPGVLYAPPASYNSDSFPSYDHYDAICL
jgi:hypothetical protein